MRSIVSVVLVAGLMTMTMGLVACDRTEEAAPPTPAPQAPVDPGTPDAVVPPEPVPTETPAPGE